MVLIRKTLAFFSLFLFIFWPHYQAQASLDVLNVDFYKTVTIDGLTVTLADYDPSVRQWMVEVLPKDNYQQVAIYPSNKSASFTLKSRHTLEYQLADSADWQKVGKDPIRAQRVLVRTLAEEGIAESSDSKIMINLSADQASISALDQVTAPEGLDLLSAIYQIDSQVPDYQLKIFYQSDSDYSKTIYSYNQLNDSWQILPSYNNIEEKFVRADIKGQNQPLVVALLADAGAYDGLASYYNQAFYRSFGYKNGNFAASRYYPKGSKLKVTRLLTGKSIIVTVNDYGPEERTGRLIDLDIAAFKQIGSTRAGVIYVKIEPYDQDK